MADHYAPNNTVEQAIRRSHCDNKGKEHACIGVMTVSPDGVKLDCKLCGGADNPLVQISKMRGGNFQKEAVAARLILGKAGLDFDALSAETQLGVLKEIAMLEITWKP